MTKSALKTVRNDMKTLVKDAQELFREAASATGDKADELRNKGLTLLEAAVETAQNAHTAAIARDAGLPYVYLGYWVPGSRKMGYKAAFSALEIYKGGAWQPLGDPAEHRAELDPLSVDPIAEQVARIALPRVVRLRKRWSATTLMAVRPSTKIWSGVTRKPPIVARGTIAIAIWISRL